MKKREILILNGEIDRNDLNFVSSLITDSFIVAAEPAPRGGKGGINPHLSRFYLDNGKIVDVFHIKPIYYATPRHQWRPLYEVASYYGNRNGMILKSGWEERIDFGYLYWYLQRQRIIKGAGIFTQSSGVKIPLFLNTTTDFFPNPATTVDGHIGYEGSTNWATTRNAAVGTGANYTGPTFVCQTDKKANTTYGIWRPFFLFDTSSIPDTNTITNAIISLAADGSAKFNTDSTSVVIVSSNPASNTALILDDYDQVGSVNFGSINIADWVTAINTYNSITLNSDGIANISKTGISKFGARTGLDLNNTAPTGINTVYAQSSENTYDPKLTVTHSNVITRTLSDSMMNASNRFSSINRSFTGTRTLSDSIMNAASRFSTVNRIQGFVRTLSDSIMNAVNRLATVSAARSFLRTLSDNIMNAASRFSSVNRTISFFRTLSDSMMNAVNRLSTVSRTLTIVRTLSDSMMNAVGRLSSFIAKVPKWLPIFKNIASWTGQSKNTTTWTPENKSDTSNQQTISSE